MRNRIDKAEVMETSKRPARKFERKEGGYGFTSLVATYEGFKESRVR